MHIKDRAWMNAIVVAAMFFLAAAIFVPAIQQRSAIDATEKTVMECVRALDKRVLASGEYDRAESSTLPEQDAWQRHLEVKYEKSGDFDTLEVRSGGPDGKFNTVDDIIGRAKTGYRKMMTNGLEKTSHSIMKGAVTGIKEGIKAKVKGKE